MSVWSQSLVSSLVQYNMMFIKLIMAPFKGKQMINRVFCNWQVATAMYPVALSQIHGGYPPSLHLSSKYCQHCRVGHKCQ